MANESSGIMRSKNKICFLFLCFFSSVFSFAQNGAGGTFTVEKDGGNTLIVQRLSWFRDDFDFRYEVFIEMQDENGNYKEIVRENKTENFIEVSLPPGQYRYRISVYNLLDQFEYTTNWINFTILQAIIPDLGGISPRQFFLNNDIQWGVDLEGMNLLHKTQVALFPKDENDKIIPYKYIRISGGKARAFFNPQDLMPGIYELRVKNPGGFEARKDFFIINQTPFDLGAAAVWPSALPLHGYLFKEFISDGFYPPGSSQRVNSLFFKLQNKRGTLDRNGFETTLFGDYFESPRKGLNLKSSVRLLGIQAHYSYQVRLPNRMMAAAFRLGGGLVSVTEETRDFAGIESETFFTWAVSLDAGFSLVCSFHRNIYTEIGVDYRHLLADGVLQPGFIRLGWRY